MATPSNINLLTRQILTSDGQVEELPIGALILPPPVGLFTELSANEICYIVFGGFFCLVNGVPLALTCIIVGAVTICVDSYEHAEAVRKAAQKIKDDLELAKAKCVSNNVAGSAALAACLAAAEAAAAKAYEDLKKQYNNVSTIPDGGAGRRPYFHM